MELVITVPKQHVRIDVRDDGNLVITITGLPVPAKVTESGELKFKKGRSK